ncbi:hypothetical protein NF552_25645 (plasmid) [Roseomonas mucosa]|nr:hypothetical protein NF552_25645 [Roseomonas mucosa]
MAAPLSQAASDAQATTTLLVPAHTDWLRNVLAVNGTTEEVGRFRAAAAGADVIPWVLGLDGLEEDWFLSLASPPDGARAISVQGAKILARRLRDAAAANHQRAMARIGTDRSCPLDLQRLVPIPPSILRLGPDDPYTRIWLWTHWGTTRPLRHVRELEPGLDGRKRRMAELRVEFWSADWSPWQAVRRLRRDWLTLNFELRPDYGDGERDGTALGGTVPAQEGRDSRKRKAGRERVSPAGRTGRG